MTRSIALAFALLATGCGANAPDPMPAPDASTDATAADVGRDAGVDAGEPCPGNWIRCDGVCVFSGNLNCGRCGYACPGATRCCTDGPQTRCSLDCSQP